MNNYFVNELKYILQKYGNIKILITLINAHTLNEIVK